MQSHIFVYRPDVGSSYSLGELIFHFDLAALFGVLNAADAKNGLNIGSFFLYNVVETNIEISNLLIGSTLCKAEPVACSLVVYAKLHSAVGAKLLCYLNEVFIS